ncbi:MAG: type III-A CRISPR-associated RAMP protein Csm5 [Syntrophomonadaceae bacterium]|nr:type III-A CRISPR-associated RAMP protein Csm5 [Syntrophomonadaceae bacterium]
MKYGHLERINLTLRMLAPVFIGSGERLNKKEYIFDAKKGIIYFLDLPRLVVFLKSRSLLSKYEEFLIQPRYKDFRVFLKENKIVEADYSSFVSYSITAGEAARVPNFREVVTFIKDADGRPYIPGSSLKGAIRTALAAQLMKKGDWDQERRNIEVADTSGPPRRYLSGESSILEKKAFYRLGIQNPKNGEVLFSPINDFMQGIRISDSAAVDFENLTLAGKYDRKPDGTFNLLPIFRECLIPGTEVQLLMTLDRPMLAKVGLDLNSIEDALHSFADDHYANFEQFFTELPEDASIEAKQGVDIILGGGAGYVSKTLTYNLLPMRDQAVSVTAKILAKQFQRHGHFKDASKYKVSPHILKTTMYAGEYYQMGKCELILK